MQIDLANTLVRKVYFYLLCIVHHCPQARAPPPLEGAGEAFSLPLGEDRDEASLFNLFCIPLLVLSLPSAITPVFFIPL